MIRYAKHRSRSRDAVIRVYDEAGNVIEMARASAGVMSAARDVKVISAAFGAAVPRNAESVCTL